jgi:predicted nuclease of predicted toxin-antitoxin system
MLDDLFPGSSQVMLLGFPGETPDEVIWDVAKERDYAIVTADTDFVRLSAQFGAPPKVIRLERMDYSTAIAATLIRSHAVAIAQFEISKKKLLVLRRS